MPSARTALILLALLLASGVFAACGSEQAADLDVLRSAPKIDGFTLEKSTAPETTTDVTESTGYGYAFSRGDDVVVVQYEGSTDASGSDWNIDSAVPVIKDATGGLVTSTNPVALDPEPATIGAWRAINGTTFSFAEAWERQQCVALVITNLSPEDAAPVLRAVDQHVIDACGS